MVVKRVRFKIKPSDMPDISNREGSAINCINLDILSTPF